MRQLFPSCSDQLLPTNPHSFNCTCIVRIPVHRTQDPASGFSRIDGSGLSFGVLVLTSGSARGVIGPDVFRIQVDQLVKSFSRVFTHHILCI